MIGYYNYTVILTYIGTCFGFAGIACVWRGGLKQALVCLMIAGFCDMFDGKIASTMDRTRQEKRFGIQIDSLSDLICFGMLPAMIAYCCTEGSMLSGVISAAYLLCALIRLAWFNVDEEERQTQESGSREIYLGLPVTSAAVLLPLFIGGGSCLNLPVKAAAPVLLLCIGAAFLTPFHLKKPGALGKVLLILVGIAGFTVVMMGGIQ